MPQESNVLRCFKCSVYQVQLVKISKKWTCYICGEKQSFKRNYGKGTGKECRQIVMKLNASAHAGDEMNLINQDSDEDVAENGEWDEDTQQQFIHTEKSKYVKPNSSNKKESKWTKFLQDDRQLLTEDDD